jgi:hypothetical protein
MAVVTKNEVSWQVSITPSGAGAAGTTQAHAIEVARRMLEDVGGGTLIVHDRRGRVREALNVADTANVANASTAAPAPALEQTA